MTDNDDAKLEIAAASVCGAGDHNHHRESKGKKTMPTRKRSATKATTAPESAVPGTNQSVGPNADTTEAEREHGMAERLAKTVPQNRRRTRPDGPREFEALLVGDTLSYRLSYWPTALVFWNGKRVAITEAEMGYLAKNAVTWKTNEDRDLGRIKVPQPMFEFYNADSDRRVEVEGPASKVPDVDLSDNFDAAYDARRRRKEAMVTKARTRRAVA